MGIHDSGQVFWKDLLVAELLGRPSYTDFPWLSAKVQGAAGLPDALRHDLQVNLDRLGAEDQDDDAPAFQDDAHRMGWYIRFAGGDILHIGLMPILDLGSGDMEWRGGVLTPAPTAKG